MKKNTMGSSSFFLWREKGGENFLFFLMFFLCLGFILFISQKLKQQEQEQEQEGFRVLHHYKKKNKQLWHSNMRSFRKYGEKMRKKIPSFEINFRKMIPF